MKRLLPVLLVALLVSPICVPVISQEGAGRLPSKVIVRIHVTKLWLAENADKDPPGNDPDLWLFTLVEQTGLGKSVRSFGERSIDPKDYDLEQNNVYDRGKDRTLSPLELMGGRGVQDTVIYSSEQCIPVRPFSLYFRMIDSDKGGSDKPGFFKNVAGNLSSYLKRFMSKGLGVIFEGVSSLVTKLFKKDFDLVGVGQKLSWRPAKRYKVLRGSGSGAWNLGAGEEWKDGELPPPGETWVSEETQVELRSGGELGAMVWFRLEVYNTGESCVTVKPKVESMKESKAAIRSVEVTKGLEVGKLGFKVETVNPLEDVDMNLSIEVRGRNFTRILWVRDVKGSLDWGGDLRLMDAGDGFLIGEFTVGAGEAEITFTSSDEGGVASRSSLSVRFPRPNIILVANEVDRIGLDPIIHGLRSEGLEFSVEDPPSTIEELRRLASDLPVVIAGGPDAPETGSLVRELLPADIGDLMRREPKVARIDWLAENPVYVIAGPDRYATRRMLSSSTSLMIDEAAKHDGDPPLVLLGPGTFMGVPQGARIEAVMGVVEEVATKKVTYIRFLLNEPARLRGGNLTYLAFGREVPLSSGITVSGRWIELEIPDYRPDNLTLAADLVDERGNVGLLRVSFRSIPTVPFLVMREVSEEQLGPLSKLFRLEAANLGDIPMTLRLAGVSGAPEFITLDVTPQSCVIGPGLSALLDLRVTASEGAPEGTYTFTVTFENVEAGVVEPLNVTVEISRGGLG